MKIFQNKKGRIIQLADKDMMKKWNPELPLIFIGYIQEKCLRNYPPEIRKDVEAYLEEVLEDVAIPKLINTLKSKNLEDRKRVAENLLEISSKNADQLKIALPHIKKAEKDPNKEVSSIMKKIIANYDKLQKRKKTAKKRAKLNALRKEMDRIDMEFAAGKISDAKYLKKQKEYLVLKAEIQQEEE